MARLFDRRRFRFYENGVISVNLPICAQVLGGRATRSTHPQVLKGFSALFGALFQCDFQVENLFFAKTKTDLLLDLKAAGLSDLCRHSVSCAHTWEMTKLHTHCGRCSQCVDRRLSALAARLEDDEDPPEMYKHDVLRAPLEGVDRTLAESYVRTLNEIEDLTDAIGFGIRFPEIARLYNHLPGSADAVAQAVFKLHKRHATQICAALDRAGRAAIPDMRRGKLPPNCLLSIVFPSPSAVPKAPRHPHASPAELPVVDEDRMVVTYGGLKCEFPPRRKLLFGLLKRMLEHPGRRVSYSTLCEKGGVWDDRTVEDSTIRGAVGRLQKHLRGCKLYGVAAAISTLAAQGRGYVVFKPERIGSSKG